MKQPGPPQPRFALYAVGATAIFLAAAALLARSEPSVDGARVTTVALVVCGTITMISAFHRVGHADGRRKKAWFVLSFGAVGGVAANAWSLITELSPLPDEWYTFGDPLLLAALVLCTAGLVIFPPVRRRRADLARMVLDGLVIGGSVLFVTSVTVFPQLLESGESQSVIGRVQLLFLPVMDVLIATLATLLMTQSGRSSRAPLVLLGAGFCLYTVADLSYAVLSVSRAQALGTYSDLGWIAGYLLFALAARHPTAGLNTDDESQETSPVLSTVVLFALFLAATVVSLVQMRTTTLSLGAALVWVMVILAVIGRQTVLVVDNERLRRNLEILVHERTRDLRGITKQQELLLTSVGDGIYGVDRYGLITFVNAATAAILGRPEPELIGRDAHDLFHAAQTDGVPYPRSGCYVTEAIRSGSTATAEEDLYVRGDGALIAVEATASPLSGDDGISGAVVVFRDVSERREVDRMKSEFVSIVSHELRTPLTSIRGSLGLVAGGALGELPPEAARMLGIALAGSERLTRLINDILDLERIESGTLALNVTVCDVRSLCEEALTMMYGLADRIDVVIGRCTGQVRTDYDRTVQTLINLVGNAVKFSEPGSRVVIEAVPVDDLVEFSVTDQGRGIPEEMLESIFTRFTQVDSSDAREKGGTGLGLAISRTIVERLGGRIWAESEVGVGSTFRFALPRATQPGPVDRPGGPSVLVCDDDPEVAQVLCAQLGRGGYRPVPVPNCDEVVAVARAERPDAVVVALDRPGTARVVAAVRADEQTSRIPVVVVSGTRPGPEDLETAVDGWVTRPVEEHQLLQTITSAIDHRRSRVEVLVVADDDASVGGLAESLERHGLTVSRARGQQEGLDLLHAQEPQVLVLDLSLSDGSGFDLVAHLRADGRLSKLPLVVCSAAEIEPADQERLSLGETLFWTRGRASPQQLERRVVELVERVVGRGAAGVRTADDERLAAGTRPGSR